MPYLVRKLLKRDLMQRDLTGVDNVQCIFADTVTSEFRTTNGTLSTWIIQNIDELNEAVLAIAVTSSKIERMDFIVIDTRLINENDLEYSQTYAGREIAIPDLQDKHYDILNITVAKLVNCADIYKKIVEQDNDEGVYIVRYVEGEIKDLLLEAFKQGRIKIDLLSKEIRKVIKPDT